MANSSTPFGLNALGHRDGSAPTMGLERVFINSSDTNLYFTGDPIARSSATPGFIQPFGGSSLAPTAAGVFAGCEFFLPSAGKVTWSSFFAGNLSAVSSTNGPVIAYIVSDPEMQFTIRGSTAGILGSSLIGSNFNITAAVSSQGNQTTGRSAVTLAAGSTTTGLSSFPFQLVDLYSNFAPPGSDGTDNTSVGNIGVVVPNAWGRRLATGLTS